MCISINTSILHLECHVASPFVFFGDVKAHEVVIGVAPRHGAIHPFQVLRLRSDLAHYIVTIEIFGLLIYKVVDSC